MKKMTDKSPIVINNSLLMDQLNYFTRPDLQYEITGEVMEFYRVVKNAMYKNSIALYVDCEIFYAIESDIRTNIDNIYIIFESHSINKFKHIYINIDLTKGCLTYEIANETPLTEDNVKTLFGNQSIVGSGNIDLYRHEFELSSESGIKHYYEHISSNPLVCDSLQDLTAVIKPTGDDSYYALSDNVTLNYTDMIWYVGDEKVLVVRDKVSTV